MWSGSENCSAISWRTIRREPRQSRRRRYLKSILPFQSVRLKGIESPTVVGAQAANEMLDIVGIKASFVLTHLDDTIYFSARSIDEINVQIMMEKMGGGGHRTIAGAQLKGSND